MYSYYGSLLSSVRTLLPSEDMAAWYRSQLAPFYRMVQQIEPYLADARPVASVGVVFSEDTRHRWKNYNREPYVKALQALTDACLERSQPLEFINCLDLADPHKDVSRFKLLVLPLTSGLTPEQLDCLRRYARGGGNVLVCGDALRHDAQGHEQKDFDLATEMGVRFKADLQATRDPWIIAGRLGDKPVAAYVKALVDVQSVQGQTLLEARRFDHSFPLLHVNALGKGQIAYLASLDSPPLSRQTIEFVAGPPPLAVHPAQHRAILTRQERQHRWVLHLLDEGPYVVEICRDWAAPTRAVEQYPATGWNYKLEKTSTGLRIEVHGEAGDRLLVLE
jgi:hypothetical protein